jgi:hypothetical protein
MPVEIQSYAAEHEEAVKAFNARLRAGGECSYKLPEEPRSTWLPAEPGRVLFEEFFLANDGGFTRGGYALKHQPFHIGGEVRQVGYLYSPVSEGIVDAQHGRVGLQLLMHALKRQPLLYCLGMGGFHNPLPTLLKGMGWTLCAVPFFFRVNRPARFFENLTYARRFKGGMTAMKLLARTGLGWLGVKAANALHTRTPADAGALKWELVEEFGGEVDELWEAARGEFSFVAVRDRATLALLYPAAKTKFLRVRVSRAGRLVGWAVALDTAMSGHKQFGDARLGTIIDGLALPGAEMDVIHAATRVLEERGVDAIVSNQAHAAWGGALRRSGYFSGPSNYIFATAPKLTALIGPFAQHQPRFHLTRGDGEGPTHL